MKHRFLNRLCHQMTNPNATRSLYFRSKSLLSESRQQQSILTEEQKEFITENGYLWIKNFVPPTVARNVQNRVNYLLDSFDPSSVEKSIFASHRHEQQHKDLYFLESGDKIRYFWEEAAFDTNGTLQVKNPRYAINKIGHALHTLDPFIHSFIYGYLPQLTYDVGMKQPIALQSMYICKQPGIGGEVGPHQDSSFLYTQPLSCYGFWLCIDDTSTQNGCIWAKPASHNDTNIGLRNRFRRTKDDYNRTELISLKDDGVLPTDNGVCIEAKCGDLVILHGELIHWSDANKSQDSRHALMMHCVDGECEYAKDNWLQYPDDNAFPRFTIQDCQNQINVRQKIIDGV